MNNNEFLTLSARGVMSVKEQGGFRVFDFLSLDEWFREQQIFSKLSAIRFFKNHQIAKVIALWKAAIREIRFK